MSAITITMLPDSSHSELHVRYSHIRLGIFTVRRKVYFPILGTIAQLRFMDPKVEIQPFGGYTTATVINDDGKVIARGKACCSLEDNYQKASGRDIALDRALEKLGGALVGEPGQRFVVSRDNAVLYRASDTA